MLTGAGRVHAYSGRRNIERPSVQRVTTIVNVMTPTGISRRWYPSSIHVAGSVARLTWTRHHVARGASGRYGLRTSASRRSAARTRSIVPIARET